MADAPDQLWNNILHELKVGNKTADKWAKADHDGQMEMARDFKEAIEDTGAKSLSSSKEEKLTFSPKKV